MTHGVIGLLKRTTSITAVVLVVCSLGGTVGPRKAEAGILAGALGGAVVGGLIGGKKGAQTGAIVGGIAGAIRR
ncbi:MAG: hypothetical protein ABJI96_15890 [Paracoccaceae bacterium]